MNHLTRREIQIAELLSEGKLNKEIASVLSISENTVKNHITSLFRKLNVRNRTQAAIAYKSGKSPGIFKLKLPKLEIFIVRG